MPLEELRSWPALRIVRAHPMVWAARGTRHEETRVLAVRVIWRSMPNYEREECRGQLRAILDRWLWDGWVSLVLNEMLWIEARERAADPRRD